MDPTANNNEMNDERNNEISDTQALLTAYALGELEGDELAKAEALIASDPAAMAEVQAIRSVGKQLEEALAAEGAGATAGLKPEQVDAIHAKAEQDDETQEAVVARLIRPWMWWTVGSAAAAMFAVAIMLPAMGEARRSARSMQTTPDVAIVDPSTAGTDGLDDSGATGGKKGNESISRRQLVAPGAVADADGQTGRGRGLTLEERASSASKGQVGARDARESKDESRLAGGISKESKPSDLRDVALGATATSASPMAPPSTQLPMSQQPHFSRSSDKADQLSSNRAKLATESDAARRGLRRVLPAEKQVLVDREENASHLQPNFNTEAYDNVTDNPFMTVGENPLSTFSIDVDTASYAQVRRFLTQNQLPPAGAVRIEEMVNYFPYKYSNPKSDERPFAVHVETGSAPWAHEHRLVKIGIKGKEIAAENKPTTNIVFLIDVSGSMMSQNKMPLLKEGMKLLVNQMDEKDHVAIAVYAGAAGMVLNSTPGSDKDTIMAAIDNLRAGGSTNGGAGIQLAYSLASKNFVKGGVNRVILASDGDFNVGTTNQDELVKLIEEKRKTGVFLSVLGFGQGNFKDSTMEKLANKGNGNYAYIDSIKEAKKVLVEQGAGTLYTIAKDVKIQVEFNPAKVQAYRLIGYENRLLAKEDFNDDTKDAGEIGAGHTVTALYEVVPVGVKPPGIPPVDELKYQTPKPAEKPAGQADEKVSDEMLTVKLRYKQPDGDVSTKMDVPVVDAGKSWHDASQDYRFAAGVAQFGMMLRNSPHKGDSTYAQVLDLAQSGLGDDEKGYRAEFITLVEKARALSTARDAKSE